MVDFPTDLNVSEWNPVGEGHKAADKKEEANESDNDEKADNKNEKK